MNARLGEGLHPPNLRIQFDSQIPLGQLPMHGGQLVQGARLHRALPLEMHNHGALLRLKRVVPTGVHQAFDDVVKGVVMVVEQHQMPFIAQGHVDQDFFLRFRVRGTQMREFTHGVLVPQRYAVRPRRLGFVTKPDVQRTF